MIDHMQTKINLIENLKLEGNAHFGKNETNKALKSYNLSMDSINSFLKEDRKTCEEREKQYAKLQITVLSNRAMCFLKLAVDSEDSKNVKVSNLKRCIKDCISVIDFISTTNFDVLDEEIKRSMRCKILYRRARAFYLLSINNVTKEKDTLVDAAHDLLELLSFDKNNKSANDLLLDIRKFCGKKKDIESNWINQVLDVMTQFIEKMEKKEFINDDDIEKKEEEVHRSLRIMLSSITSNEEIISNPITAKKLMNYNGLSTIVKLSLLYLHCLSSHTGENKNITIMKRRQSTSILAFRILITLYPSIDDEYHNNLWNVYDVNSILGLKGWIRLTQLVEKCCNDITNVYDSSKDNKNTEDEIAAIAMGLAWRTMIPLLYSHKRESTMPTNLRNNLVTLINRMCLAGIRTFSSLSTSTRSSHTVLDLLTSWFVRIESPIQDVTELEIRKMSPRNLVSHRKTMIMLKDCRREKWKCDAMVIISPCEHSGFLDAFLDMASSDKFKRRQCITLLTRLWGYVMPSDVIDTEKLKGEHFVKELICLILENKSENKSKPILSIEKIEFEEKINVEPQNKDIMVLIWHSVRICILIISLLNSPSPSVGTWALVEGWDNGNGLMRFLFTLHSSFNLVTINDNYNNSLLINAVIVASETLSIAASVKSTRSYVDNKVIRRKQYNNILQKLLRSDRAEVRSNAASTIAKIGLIGGDEELGRHSYTKRRNIIDEGELLELLGIAGVLLDGNSDTSNPSFTLGLDTRKGNNIFQPNINDNIDNCISIFRGIELVAYLSTKTFVKEEIAHGYKVPESSGVISVPILGKLVQLCHNEEISSSHEACYGLILIFSNISVSNLRLRKEAFVDKNFTMEEYDELQELSKTKEQNMEEYTNSEKNKSEVDTNSMVCQRIRYMTSVNVPRAMVHLMECFIESGHSKDIKSIEINEIACSNTLQEKLSEVFVRIAEEKSCRGAMIQEGCLSCCLKIIPEDNKSSKQQKLIARNSAHCIAKLLVTTNPILITFPQRVGAIRPLVQLVSDHLSTDLQKFEALLSLTNLASVENDYETKSKIIENKGLSVLQYAMMSDHHMVRCAATETVTNLLPDVRVLSYLSEPTNMRIWVAFACDYEENESCARAAVGCLAMASLNINVAKTLCRMHYFEEMVKSLIQCGVLQLMHRILVVLLHLIEHGGCCKHSVITNGGVRFCEVYVTQYHDGKKINNLNISSTEHDLFFVTIDLAKEIVKKGS